MFKQYANYRMRDLQLLVLLKPRDGQIVYRSDQTDQSLEELAYEYTADLTARERKIQLHSPAIYKAAQEGLKIYTRDCMQHTIHNLIDNIRPPTLRRATDSTSTITQSRAMGYKLSLTVYRSPQ
jgi:tRNA A-37 threonylcarbamoyl transferase component Bud32